MAEPTMSTQFEAAGVWLDLGIPRKASYRRGKDRALDKTAPGRMVLTYANNARQMDPSHNAFLTLLRPSTPIRLRATWAGTTHTLFTGYLESIVQHFGDADKPRDAIAVLTVVDGLAKLAAAGVPSAWEIAMRDESPKSWYRFAERTGPYAIDQIAGNTGVYFGTPEYETTSLLDFENDSAVTFPQPNIGYAVLPPSAMPPSASWSISMVFELSGPPALAQNVIYQTSYPYGLQITHDDQGRILVEIRNSAGVITASARSSFAFTGGSTICNIVAAAGQTMKIYAANMDVTGVAVGTAHTLPNSYFVVGMVGSLDLVVDELVFYNVALTTAQMLEHWDAFFHWAGDTVAERVGRVLDAVDWPMALRDITADAPGTLRGYEQGTALFLLQTIESTIEGRLWIDPDGILRLLRHTALDSAPYTTVQAAFTDQSGGLGYQGLGSYALGWELLTNVIRRINGESVVAVRDEASIAAYGLRDQTEIAEVESQYETLEHEYDLASYRLSHYADPVPYMDGLKLLPSTNPAVLYPLVLSMDLNDRISVARTPQGIGAPLATEARIEGIAVDIAPKSWKWEYSIDATYARRYFVFNETLWGSTDWRFTA